MNTKPNNRSSANSADSNQWFVLDQFSTDGKPTAGPFPTREAAEAERVQLNIADDCFVARRRTKPIST